MRYVALFIIGLVITIALLAGLPFLLRVRKNPQRGGKRAANTSGIKSSQVYTTAMNGRKIRTAAVSVLLAACMIGSFALLARPVSTSSYNSLPARKDIMLCLDVSGSLCGQNLEVIKAMREIIKGLEGERIGITVFNASAIVDVPLTDDYDYVSEKLDELETFLKYEDDVIFGNYMSSLFSMDEDTLAIENYYVTAISYGSDTKGSSLIGEGLATALYAFPHLEEEDRSRAIILSTDNEELKGEDPPIMELEDAAAECKRTGVKVIALYPAQQSEEIRYMLGLEPKDPADENNLKVAAESTGGAMYPISDRNASSDIVNAVNHIERKYTEQATTTTVMYDSPEILFVVLLVLIVFAAGLKGWWRS